MAPNAEDLAKRLAALSERFTTLAATLAQATQQVQAGTVPSETVIDEITKIRTDFVALVQCLIKARDIRQAAQDPKAFDSEDAPAFLNSIPAFAALLSIIEGRDALDDDKFAVLDEQVTQAFGRTLAVAAARGKLTVGAGSAPVVDRTAPPA